MRTDESPAFYADGLFPRLASAHSFLKGYRDASRGAHLCGFTVAGGVPPRLVACRGVPTVATTAWWHMPEAMPVALPIVRDGTDVRVRLPRIGAWECGYLRFINETK